jgi:hypothetical protein
MAGLALRLPALKGLRQRTQVIGQRGRAIRAAVKVPSSLGHGDVFGLPFFGVCLCRPGVFSCRGL